MFDQDKIKNFVDKAINENLTVQSHTKRLTEHSKILAQHSKILEEHSKILEEHSKILAEHSQTLNEHTVKLDKLSNQISHLTFAFEENKHETRILIESVESKVDFLIELVSPVIKKNEKFEQQEITLQNHEMRIQNVETAMKSCHL